MKSAVVRLVEEFGFRPDKEWTEAQRGTRLVRKLNVCRHKIFAVVSAAGEIVVEAVSPDGYSAGSIQRVGAGWIAEADQAPTSVRTYLIRLQDRLS